MGQIWRALELKLFAHCKYRIVECQMGKADKVRSAPLLFHPHRNMYNETGRLLKDTLSRTFDSRIGREQKPNKRGIACKNIKQYIDVNTCDSEMKRLSILPSTFTLFATAKELSSTECSLEESRIHA